MRARSTLIVGVKPASSSFSVIIAQLSGMLAAIVLGRWLWRKDA